jgi:hypothetical protein
MTTSIEVCMWCFARPDFLPLVQQNQDKDADNEKYSSASKCYCKNHIWFFLSYILVRLKQTESFS